MARYTKKNFPWNAIIPCENVLCSHRLNHHTIEVLNNFYPKHEGGYCIQHTNEVSASDKARLKSLLYGASLRSDITIGLRSSLLLKCLQYSLLPLSFVWCWMWKVSCKKKSKWKMFERRKMIEFVCKMGVNFSGISINTSLLNITSLSPVVLPYTNIPGSILLNCLLIFLLFICSVFNHPAKCRVE